MIIKPKHTLLALVFSCCVDAQTTQHFDMPASALTANSTGIFRSFCLTHKLFVTFNSKKEFSSISVVHNTNNTPLYCEQSEFTVLSEQQIPALALGENSSGIGRILKLGDAKFILYTSRNGSNDLTQFF
jgi:hypothetical protein